MSSLHRGHAALLLYIVFQFSICAAEVSTRGKKFSAGPDSKMEHGEAELACSRTERNIGFGVSIGAVCQTSLLFQAQGGTEPPGSSVHGLAPCD